VLFDAYVLATHGKNLLGGEGIIATDIENTLKHIERLSKNGMKVTDQVIIDIMNNQ
jgi:L-cysteine desulfidase